MKIIYEDINVMVSVMAPGIIYITNLMDKGNTTFL